MVLDREKINLELARQKSNVTQLASDCGISRARLYVVLNSRSVAPATVGKIAEALGVDVTEIIEE